MKDILPPYGLILRNAIQTRDRELMQAYLKYSDFMRAQNISLSDSQRSAWDAAHRELDAALKQGLAQIRNHGG